MPFNVSGVFSRIYNWVADRDNGIKILAARMDAEADDVASAINAIVGQSQPFINPVKAPNGTGSLPAYSFESDPNLGIYRVSADRLGFAVLGGPVLEIGSGGVYFSIPAEISDGTAALPTLRFGGGYEDTGIFRQNTGGVGIGFTVNGVARAILRSTGLQVDVPVTGTEFRVNTGIVGTAVTQTNIDTTSGRLLKTGDYGLGQIIEYSGSINTLSDLPTGFYRVLSSATGTFPGSLTAFNMLVIRRGTTPFANSVQIAYGTGLNTDQYMRVWDGTSWSTWRLSFDQANILGTVSQSGGTPTGSVMQRGSNGNGEWVRFADGTQICTHSIASGATTTAAGSIFTSGDETWTFPQAFTSATGLTVTASVVSSGRWCNVYNATASDATIRQFNSSSNSGTPNIRVMAIGRWF